jgi:sugar phosphate isomerase/epimerase
MKLACVVSTPDVAQGELALLSGTFEEKLAKARGLGYQGVELMVRDAASLRADDIREALRRHGLEMPQIVTGEVFGVDGLALLHPDVTIEAAAMRRTQAIVQLAGALNRGTMVNVGRLRGRLDWFGPDGAVAARDRLVAKLGVLADYAETCGVRITLEPLNRFQGDFVHTSREGIELVGEVGRPNFGLMLDVFHMNIEDPSIEKAIHETGPLLWHVHIADSNRLPPGQGHLDFKSIQTALSQIGYDGYLSAELLPLPDPDTAARLTIEHMRQVFA